MSFKVSHHFMVTALGHCVDWPSVDRFVVVLVGISEAANWIRVPGRRSNRAIDIQKCKIRCLGEWSTGTLVKCIAVRANE